MEEKALSRLDRIIQRVQEKLPTEIDLDEKALLEMGLAGTAGYIFAPEILRIGIPLVSSILDPDIAESLFDSLAGNPLTRVTGIGAFLYALGFGRDKDTELTNEEKEAARLAQEEMIEEWLTEEHKIGIAILCALLIPKTPEIMTAGGKIIDGVIPG